MEQKTQRYQSLIIDSSISQIVFDMYLQYNLNSDKVATNNRLTIYDYMNSY